MVIDFNQTDIKKLYCSTSYNCCGTSKYKMQIFDNNNRPISKQKTIKNYNAYQAAISCKITICSKSAAKQYKSNEQMKFFITADRFLMLAGELPEYEEMYAQFDRYLPEALVEAEKAADDFARDFVSAHKDDALHYFVGGGTLYGATYSYAMCYWEEMHWHRTKSIHSAEFFHGMLEIVEKDTPVTLFISEDKQRPLGERVAKFLPRVCDNYTVIDTRDYALTGISEAYRGRVSHLVMHAVTDRIDAHLVDQTGHDMDLRRYYRKMEY